MNERTENILLSLLVLALAAGAVFIGGFLKGRQACRDSQCQEVSVPGFSGNSTSNRLEDWGWTVTPFRGNASKEKED